jgi:hypothetical protein
VRADDDGEASQNGPTPAALFELLWASLTDVLGPGATATLLRRALKHALPRAPALEALQIGRERLDYRYKLPDDWSRPTPELHQALSELGDELCLLLQELTGPVMVRRLTAIPELRRSGILSGKVSL